MKTGMFLKAADLKSWTQGSGTIIGAALCSLVLAACGPKQGVSTMESEVDKLAACTTQQKSVPLEAISIQGTPVASKSQSVMSRLSEDPACAGLNVEWKVQNGKILSEDQSGIVSTFSQPGHYLIQAKLESATSSTVVTEVMPVVDNAPILSGPQVGMLGLPLTFSVVIPEGMNVARVDWFFGDGQNGSGLTATHTYETVGTMALRARVVLANGEAYGLSQDLTILFYYDDFECLADARILAPQSAEVGDNVEFKVNIPSCLTASVSNVKWNFGDSSSAMGKDSTHAYAATGLYEVSAEIQSPLSTGGPLFVLKQGIRILEKTPQGPEPKCSTLGEIRTEYVDENLTAEHCGVDGEKSVLRHTKVVYECRYEDLVQDWVEISRDVEIKDESSCSDQSCVLPDGTKIRDGEEITLFSSNLPANQCTSETRSCDNGVLSGSASYVHRVCNAGCGDFGSHGTVKTAVVTGETQVALQCAFGEQGYFDIFNTVEDRTCNAGTVVSSNQRTGGLKTAGSCPTYSWVSTGNYTQCTADCGGQQNLIHVCRDSQGRDSDPARCGAEPVVQRACDANPDAVARQEITVTTEDAGSSASCPKNQIGIVVKTREVKNIKNYACINHSVQLASEQTQAGAWVEESYCRAYTAYRCSQDSLSDSEARGRRQWMEKCQDQVPVIKEFLTNFDHLSTTTSTGGIDAASRVLYPTFMNAGVKPEKVWVAPKKATASCEVPPLVYIAGVCVSSCATPEQMILTEIRGKKEKSFIDALVSQTPKVVTLASADSVSSKNIVETPVETWVTEMIDTDHQIIEFRMASGGQLRLTRNHPLLASSGEMRLASDFKVGDSLLKLGGVADRIVSLQSAVHHGKVYNLFTTSAETHKNIVVIGGYLNGTAFFQNEGAGFVNQKLLRARLTRGVFGK